MNRYNHWIKSSSRSIRISKQIFILATVGALLNSAALSQSKLQDAAPDVSIEWFAFLSPPKKGACNAAKIRIKNRGTRSTGNIAGILRTTSNRLLMPVWKKRLLFSSLKPGESRTVIIRHVNFENFSSDSGASVTIDPLPNETQKDSVDNDNNYYPLFWLKINESCTGHSGGTEIPKPNSTRQKLQPKPFR